MCYRLAPTGYSVNDARFYYEREQLLEVQVHIQRPQKKILHREPEEASAKKNTQHISHEVT